MELFKKYKWKNVKDIILPFIISIILAISALYIYFDYHYSNLLQVRTQKLEYEYHKSIDLLDKERSRVVFEIENTKNIFDFERLFISGVNLPDDYKKLKNSPFCIPSFNNDNDWTLRSTSQLELLKSLGLNPSDNSLTNFLSSSKVDVLVKNEVYDLKIGQKSFQLKPMVVFEFMNKEYLNEFYNGFFQTVKANPPYQNLSQKEIDEFINKDDLFTNLLLNGFTMIKDAGITYELGKLENPDYYFNKDVFLVTGYFDVSEATNSRIDRWYILKMGILKNEELYLISYNIPIKDNYNDLKQFNSLIQGVRILN